MRFKVLVDDKGEKDYASSRNIPITIHHTRYPAMPPVLADAVVPPGMAVAHEFEAPDAVTANLYYRSLIRNGIPQDPNYVARVGMDGTPGVKPWRFNGDSPYLNRFIAAFNLDSTVALKHVQGDPRFKKLGGLLNQVQELYHPSPKENGVAVLAPTHLAHVAETLDRADRQVQESAVLLAAMATAVDDARRAFGSPAPRSFTTPAAASHEPDPRDAEIARLKGDVERLTAELEAATAPPSILTDPEPALADADEPSGNSGQLPLPNVAHRDRPQKHRRGA